MRRSKTIKRWASDVIVDLLHTYKLPYAAMNPGASYRGLHDSLVNYGRNKPYLMLCQHEETAVQIAHGYAKATGKPMVAILHNLVGLLHANMAVYYAYADRAPVFIIGATGPMDETKRRPRIDWIHTALVQGEAVRAYTKWDYQPTVIDGVPVYDVNARLNFPSRHPLNLSMVKDVFRDADALLCLDTRDWERATTELVSTTRKVTSIVPEGCKWIDIGFGDLEISSWAMDYQRLAHADLRIIADTTLAIPALTKLLKGRVKNVAQRRKAAEELGAKARKAWDKEAKQDWDASPITLPRLASEVWNVIRNEDWVLTANTLEDWTRILWDFDKPYRHPGKSLGTATQIGISLGVALAHRDAKRLVVDLQPDGDLMFDAGALWVAAKHRIPMLVVMYNNRAYYNDWEHQIRMAKLRGTPVERAYIGMDMDDPAPDFASLAKAIGWYAEGPIDKPGAIAGALKRAIKRVKAGQPALIDTITQKR